MDVHLGQELLDELGSSLEPWKPSRARYCNS